MTQRQRMNKAREYSRACRIRRVRRVLWAVDAVLLLGVLALLLWCLHLDRQQAVRDDLPEVEPTAALLSAVPVELPEEIPGKLGEMALFRVTGYCACCTPYAEINRDEEGRVLTASGEWTKEGACVAVDPDVIPLGSTVVVEGREYKALDVGVKGYVVDILMSHEAAQVAGVKEALVRWETE